MLNIKVAGGVSIKQLSEFLNDWSGVVLLAEADDHAGETNYHHKRRLEIVQSLKLPLTGCALIAIAAYAAYYQFQLQLFISLYPVLLLLKLAGVAITGLLLWYQVDKANPLLQQIFGLGSQTGCNAVLGSKQAKLFNAISWSEIGFFYFAGGFLSLVLVGMQAAVILQVLVLLNILALPHTIFSIYYQWQIAKQWCPLCLSVQAILITEFIVAISTHTFFITTTNQHLPTFLLSTVNYQLPTFFAFLLPVLSWYLIKPLLLQSEEAKRTKRELLKIKYDNRIFNALLPKQKQLTANADGLGITMGNTNATNTIIKVCNPYCPPCARAHPEIDELLEANPDLKVQILFTATNTENDRGNKPVKHLLAITAKNNEALSKKALDDWYLPANKDYEVFALKYPMNGELKLQEEKVAAMSNWCKDTGIAFTPTFFVNGYQLPDVYTVGDLKYFLSG